MKRALLLMVSLLLVVGTLAAGCSPSQSDKPLRFTIAIGGTASSSWYVLHSTKASLLDKYSDDLQPTTFDSGGAFDCIAKLGEGQADVATGSGVMAIQDSYTGTGGFDGDEPLTELRALPCDAPYVYAIVVAEGITSFDDLKGKPMNPGKPGGGDRQKFYEICRPILGIEADWYEGTLAEAVDAMKNRDCVGYVKATTLDKLDASMLDVMSTQPISIIGFTKEQTELVSAQSPRMIWYYVEKGHWAELPDVGDFYLFAEFNTQATTSDFPQWAGYELTKTWWDHADELHAVFPAFSYISPQDQMERWAGFADVPPMHAGVIQYWKEEGVTGIPERLIPPEYKD